MPIWSNETMKAKITKRMLDSLRQQARSKQKTLYCWDAELIGFGALATRTGAASFFVEYRLGGRAGRNRRFSLGRYGKLTPDEARRFAKEKLGEIARGIDVAEVAQEQQRRISSGTFKDICERYLTINGRGKKSWPETRRLLEWDAIPALGSKPIVSITRGDVAAMLDEVSSRSPSVARALFAAIRPLFRWVTDRGLIEHNPILDMKGPSPLAKRKRTLNEAEIIAFWKATNFLGWPFAHIYKLLLLTGQRREEVAGMRWEEIDFHRAIWRLPSKEEYQPQRTKNGEEHIVHLSPQALEIISELPREERGLVFTTTGVTSVSGFSKAKTRLDCGMSAKLGRDLRLWRNHDLRRTMSTMMGEHLDIDQSVIDRIQNHITGVADGLKGTYQQQKYLPKRKVALLAWGAFIETLVFRVIQKEDRAVSA
jgi:integrase